MAKQTINLGTSANKGDGDPLRTAFDKVNDNFDEVYSLLGAEGGDTDDVVAPMLVHNDHTNITVTRDDAANKIIFSVDPYDGDITGSVFGDDSTLLVDGVNNTIPKANIEDSANWDTAFGWGNHTAGGYAPQTTTYTKTEVDSAISAVNTLDGDFTGSVFGDDSTLLVDGVNNKIVGAVDTASLRTSETKIALGENAGLTTQGVYAVAVGNDAGNTTQGYGATAVGNSSGSNTQGNFAVAIGFNAGTTSQGISAVAIGDTAGKTNQGEDSIAIGKEAGETNQAANSIILNATGVAVGNTQASSLVIKPIRSAVGTTMLMYDVTSGEVTHTASPIITGDITGSVFGDDSTVLVDGVNNKIVGDIETASLRTSESNIALGNSAGETTQGTYAVAVGYLAGRTTQGASAVAIGNEAGYTNQAARSIVINATGTTLNNIVEDVFVVKPVRGVAGATLPAGFKQVAYNPTTGEFIYYDM